MSDLVKRLRAMDGNASDLMLEAAAELERLQAKLPELEGFAADHPGSFDRWRAARERNNATSKAVS